MADGTYQPKVYRKSGGDEQVIASGGKITVESGGSIALDEGATVTGAAYAADGLGSLRLARATFDPSAVTGDRTIAAHDLSVTLPINAIVVGGFVDVITTFTSATDAATIALSVQGANDIVAAIAISDVGNPWDAGKHAIIPKANTPETTGVKCTAARAITATVAVEALTAGKAVVWLYYVVSA